jgi:hypothetical protein
MSSSDGRHNLLIDFVCLFFAIAGGQQEFGATHVDS